jgi:hypothetical protein
MIKNDSLQFGYEKILDWYEKSIVNYAYQYQALYTAYNAWYCEVLATANSREAIDLLKKRFVIWDDYCNGHVLRALTPYMEKLVDLTQKEPLHSQFAKWNGEVGGVYDWQSLIEYWYQVRCLVVHGADIKQAYVWLAYETLDIFMQEIILRAGVVLKQFPRESLKELAAQFDFNSGKSEKNRQLQQKLFLKYIALPDIWQVDMQPVAHQATIPTLASLQFKNKSV